MFVNRIDGISKVGFKGYQHLKNNVGETVTKFNYAYDYDNETCEVHIYRATPTEKYNYKLSEAPIATVKLNPDGTVVNIQELTNLDKDAPYAYKIVRKDKQTGNIIWEGADTGMKLKNENGEYVFRVSIDQHADEIKDASGNTIGYKEDFYDSKDNYKYTLVTRNGTSPMVQGPAYLLSPDSFYPGVRYRTYSETNTGDIVIDNDVQKKAENTNKNFANSYGGSLAGVQEKIQYLKNNGYKIISGTPIANGSRAWSLGYWNINNDQMSPNVGTIENFASFARNLYANGMKYINDGTFTSEGHEGIRAQYAERWGKVGSQAEFWFKMNGIKDSNLGLGVIPRNAEILNHRVVNAPYNYELQDNGKYKKVVNPNYNPKKETIFQIYDATQVTKEQLKDLDKVIVNYQNLKDGQELTYNTHDDTVINYAFQIDPKEYDNRISALNEYNKLSGNKIDLNSSDGTVFVGQFKNFRIDKKTEGGFVAWDANTDMLKLNFEVSGYDEKQLQSIVEPSERDLERQKRQRGAYEVQDMALQSGKYWTGKVKDIQTIYTAQMVGNAKTAEVIDKLIKEGKLPEETRIDNEIMNNILNGHYLLSPKGVLSKEDVTVKALMRAPLDTIEFGENTVGVLCTSFFSNRATSKETLGVSRFDLMKQNNPHLIEPYKKTYNKVNGLYSNQIRNFAESIISKVNETSNEKLLDASGNYTEYGEYVMELVGQDINKYAFIKALSGDSIQTKLLDNGEITYDYDLLKEHTTLKALGINATNPEDEAVQLEKKIEKGMSKLSDEDISYVAKSISKRIAGTDTSSFRIAEALVNRASLGLDWRLDACKDVMDTDTIRNEESSFDDTWNSAIDFQYNFVQAVKSEDPNVYVMAEITDVDTLTKDTYGLDSCPNSGKTYIGQKFNGEPDALAKFFAQTGITSESALSYFFTNLLTSFSPDFERGIDVSESHDDFKRRLDLLLETRSADYLRNLYTFMGTHDKPRMIHGLALDMNLFHANLKHNYADFNQSHKNREAVIQVLSGVKSPENIPIELRLNVDNNDYFTGVSSRAVAMSKLISEALNDETFKFASDDDKKLITNALVDLANGNYLGVGETENLQKIKLKELSSLENAFNEILNLASNNGLLLSEQERKILVQEVVKKANGMVNNTYGGDTPVMKDMPKYLVRGGLSWQSLDANIKAINEANAKDVLEGDCANLEQYSLYTVQLAKLLKDAYKETKLSPSVESSINSGIKAFVKKYDAQTIASNSDSFKMIEDPYFAMRKNAYAAKDIKTAILMAVKQAEFKSGKSISNKQELIDNLYVSATAPAVTKAAMIMEFLKGLPGMPTMYAGDEMAMTGYEEKAKNIYLQNRNALPWTETNGDNAIAKYRKTVMEMMNGAIKDRSNPELAALNQGTPYTMEVQTNSKTRAEIKFRIQQIWNKLGEINAKLESDKNNALLLAEKETLEQEKRFLTKELAKVAYMMHSANGDTTVTLFNVGDLEFGNRVNYFEKYGLDTEEKRKKFFAENNISTIDEKNPYIPILPKSDVDAIMLTTGVAIPVGTIFMNANSKDKTEYIVKDINGKKGIVNKNGGKIVMDGITAKNGVMILKKVIKKISFKGKEQQPFFNAKYNFISNPYKQNEQPIEGEKLHIIAK